jgi:uncharacterized membrane protein
MDEADRGLVRTTAASAVDADPTFEERERRETDEYGDTERLWEQPTRDRGASALELQTDDEEAVPSVAAIEGHPLHPAIVPLPIGAFVGAFVADVVYARTGDRFWARGAHVLSVAGVATGLLAGALGATDFVGRDRIRSRGSAWIHAGGNLAAVGLGIASIRLARDRNPRIVVPTGLAVSTSIVAILAVTGWLGGELAFRHRIGVTRA